MPSPKLNNADVTTSQPPQSNERGAGPVRSGTFQVDTSPAASSTNAAGSNHEIWPPKSALNRRVSPVIPHGEGPPLVTLPFSLPVRRPKPLYPNIRFHRLLFCEPPMYGRFAAGVSCTIAIHQPAERSIATPPRKSCQNATAKTRRSCKQVDETERGQHDERLQHLGEEAEADQREREHDPPGTARLERTGQGVCRNGEHEHEQRVGVVEPEHQCGNRRRREHQAREQSGGRREPSADRRVEHTYRGDAFERLGNENAPRVHTKHPSRQLHHPQESRRFVDRDRVAGIERTEEERFPALRARLDRGRVVRVGPTRRAESPEVQQCRRAEQRDEGGPLPGGSVGTSAQQPGHTARWTPVRRGAARLETSAVGRAVDDLGPELVDDHRNRFRMSAMAPVSPHWMRPACEIGKSRSRRAAKGLRLLVRFFTESKVSLTGGGESCCRPPKEAR